MILYYLTFFIKKRKKRDDKSYAVRYGELFTPEKFLKINDNTSGKYLISTNALGENSNLYIPVTISCYKKNSDKDNKLQSTMIWQVKIKLPKKRIDSNSHLKIKETLSIPSFLKIQVSDFYTLIPLMIYTYNHNELKAVDAYFWLVFKITNGEYLGNYKINYDLSAYHYKLPTFGMGSDEGFTEIKHLLIPQITMIGSNLFQIDYNWKFIDVAVQCIDNFRLLWIPMINFLNMIKNDNNIEDRYHHIRIDVESFNSVTSDLSDISYNLNVYPNPSSNKSNWQAILETPKIDTLLPLVNIKYPDREIKETKVYPYFWNNNNIAIKVQYYVGSIFDLYLGVMVDEYFILYDIETEKWRFIEIQLPPTGDLQSLIVDNKLNFAILGEDIVSIPI